MNSSFESNMYSSEQAACFDSVHASVGGVQAMLGVGYERPPHNPEDDILQPSTSSPDLAPADRSAASALGSSHTDDCHCLEL